MLIASYRFSLRSLIRTMATQSPVLKKQKTDHIKAGPVIALLLSTHHHQIIGTHNGTFHCDEALAVFLLRQTTAYQGAGLCFTLSPALLFIIVPQT